jgi:hypothetical protein
MQNPSKLSESGCLGIDTWRSSLAEEDFVLDLLVTQRRGGEEHQ